MKFTNETLDFNALTSEEIQETLKRYNIALSVEEILRIQNQILQRPPSLAECILWSIEGSEHCSYKSSRPYLKQFITDGPNVILGAKEDAGIISIATDNDGYRYGLVLSHESHNHPSQIVPYEGAATGIGGNVRDVCCMGAQVIAVADGLRFGDIRNPRSKWIHEGVVAGIAGYGNPIGVPNIAGDIYYDSGYDDNCLVTVVTLGIVREDQIIHSFAPVNANGYDIILVGKPTDNSGFGGASFASLKLEEEKKDQNKGAVQEPNAFLERHLLKATSSLFEILNRREELKRVGFKDLGAGGVACASVELADSAGYGAEIDLDQVPVGMQNLHPSVILCSETQERFMWVSPQDLSALILSHYNERYALPLISKGALARIIGKIRNDQNYRVTSSGSLIVDAPASEVTQGFRPIRKPKCKFKEPQLLKPQDYSEILIRILSHENIASRKPIYENYDKQVQGRSILEAGDADAGVLQPFNSTEYPKEIQKIGVALATDQNPRYNKIDPYWGAVNAVAEAIRNVVAVGATPQAISDCLCYGNPEKPEQMWEFAEGTRGVADACKAFHLIEYPEAPLPIIAGNVSFYNESDNRSIPPSPIIACVGKISDIRKVVPMPFQKPRSALFLIGDRKAECGGSIYYALFGELGANLPHPDLKELQKSCKALVAAMTAQLILSCHDISDGGIATTLAEMSFGNRVGCRVNIPGELRADYKFFSESGGWIVEVDPIQKAAFLELFRSQEVNVHAIGQTIAIQRLQIDHQIDMEIEVLWQAWSEGLRSKLE
jgi:phosphoribosylformylglycinamidine synthase